MPRRQSRPETDGRNPGTGNRSGFGPRDERDDRFGKGRSISLHPFLLSARLDAPVRLSRRFFFFLRSWFVDERKKCDKLEKVVQFRFAIGKRVVLQRSRIVDHLAQSAVNLSQTADPAQGKIVRQPLFVEIPKPVAGTNRGLARFRPQVLFERHAQQANGCKMAARPRCHFRISEKRFLRFRERNGNGGRGNLISPD